MNSALRLRKYLLPLYKIMAGALLLAAPARMVKAPCNAALALIRKTTLWHTNSDLGSLKLTLQKFYRINGGSTQLKGVVPDVIIPDQYEYLEFREKDNEDAMKWDEIKEANYTKWNSGLRPANGKKPKQCRIANTPAFSKIKETTEWLSKQNDKEYPLQLDKVPRAAKENPHHGKADGYPAEAG
jgi:hypothetical protein